MKELCNMELFEVDGGKNISVLIVAIHHRVHLKWHYTLELKHGTIY